MSSVLNANALATLAHVKTALGVTAETDDNFLETIINAASDEIESRTGRKLKRRDYNGESGTHETTAVADEPIYVFSGDGTSKHILPNYPIDEDATFTLESLATRGSGGETWDELSLYTDYVVDYERGLILLDGGRFYKGLRNYRLTYSAGYEYGEAQPYVPADLEKACIELTKVLYRDSEGVASETIGSWARSYITDKTNSFVERVILKYRSDSNFL